MPKPTTKFAIRFAYPEADGYLYAGWFKDTLGWAPTLATAALFDTREEATRILKNGYGPTQEQFGIVISVGMQNIRKGGGQDG